MEANTDSGPRQSELDDLQFMIRLLIRAVEALGEDGQTEIACRLAAAAWVALDDARPEEAEKLDSAIRSLKRLDPDKQMEALMSHAAVT
jgi:hypothetical protein